jgi:LPPG:FO 2-phospho-L-lactate transferase
MKIVVLAGGVGGARFVRGVREAVRRAPTGSALADAVIDVIVVVLSST